MSTSKTFWIVEWYKKIHLTPSNKDVRFRRFKLFRSESQAREWAKGRDVNKIAKLHEEKVE